MTEEPPETQVGASDPIEFNVFWPADAAVGAQVVTHFGVLNDGTAGPDAGLYLLMGQAVPPPWFTDIARNRGLEESGTDLQIQVRAAVYMTRTRARELHNLLGSLFGLGETNASIA
jgi:hypothetical protein